MQTFKLTKEDVENYKLDLIAMFKQSFKKNFPKESFEVDSYGNRVESLKSYINEEKAIVFGSKNDLGLAGFVWFFEKHIPNDKIIHINSFVVHENYRGQGVGTSLWSEVEKYASQRGIKELELLVTKNNEDAVRFYEKRDFEVERLVMKKRL